MRSPERPSSDRRKLFLGIDGGGSKSRALIVDSENRPIAAGLAAGSNPHNIGFAKAAQNIDEALQDALARVAFDKIEIESAFCGIAGIRNEAEQAALARELLRFEWAQTARLTIDHDLAIAFRASLGAGHGICLICGTGSSCYGRSPREATARASGRDLGDEDPGSGYSIGLSGIESGLCRSSSDDRESVAKRAPDVIRLASQGNESALSILRANAASLATLLQRAHAQLDLEDSFDLALTGGLGSADTLYREIALQAIHHHYPQARIRFATQTPVEAAAEWALSNRLGDA